MREASLKFPFLSTYSRDHGKAEISYGVFLLHKDPKNTCLPIKDFAKVMTGKHERAPCHKHVNLLLIWALSHDLCKRFQLVDKHF